jgi:cytochrome b subunit of formate dehydrogenase
MWYGERDPRFRLEGAIAVHDALTYVSLVLFSGHLYLAILHPATRHALRGITAGSVRADWAVAHHAKWVAGLRSGADAESPSVTPSQIDTVVAHRRTPADRRTA